jgi:small-conductance mechanosensitive channel
LPDEVAAGPSTESGHDLPQCSQRERLIGHERGRRAAMNLAPYHSWIVFIHVVGVILFLIGHGVSVFVAWRLRTERDVASIRTLLDLSRRSIGVMSIGLVTWFLGGILAGFSGSWWTSGQLWIWASLVLAIVVVGMMTPMGRFYFNRIRAAVGVDPRTNAADPNFVVDQGAVEAAIASGNPMLLTVVGVGALVILAWLMIVKPF